MTAKLTPNPSHLFFLQMGHERCLCDRPCRYECITTRACHTKAFCMLLWLFPFGSYTFTHNALKDFWQDSNPKVVVGEGGGPILSLGPHADILSWLQSSLQIPRTFSFCKWGTRGVCVIGPADTNASQRGLAIPKPFACFCGYFHLEVTLLHTMHLRIFGKTPIPKPP